MHGAPCVRHIPYAVHPTVDRPPPVGHHRRHPHPAHHRLRGSADIVRPTSRAKHSLIFILLAVGVFIPKLPADFLALAVGVLIVFISAAVFSLPVLLLSVTFNLFLTLAGLSIVVLILASCIVYIDILISASHVVVIPYAM